MQDADTAWLLLCLLSESFPEFGLLFVFSEVGFTYVQIYNYFTLNPSVLGEVLNSDILSRILTAVN